MHRDEYVEKESTRHMVIQVSLTLLISCTVTIAQVAIPVPRCQVGKGVIRANYPYNPACVTVPPPPDPTILGVRPEFTQSGLAFPHPTSADDRTCVALRGVVTHSYPLPLTIPPTWSANVQIIGYLEGSTSDTDDINFTAAIAYIGADGNMDIRALRFGAEQSNDDTPNGSTLASPYEPYVTTIHDIEPRGGGLNVPSPRRDYVLLACRKHGPTAILDGINQNNDEEDLNDGIFVATEMAVRWEDSSNVVQDMETFPLTSTDQTIIPNPDGGLPIEPPVGSILSYLPIPGETPQWASARAAIVSPHFIPFNNASLGPCSHGAGSYPQCNDTTPIPGYLFRNGGTDCAVVTWEVPDDVASNVPMRIELPFNPTVATGNMYFRLRYNFYSIGSDIAGSVTYANQDNTAVVACTIGSRQLATFANVVFTGGAPGDGMRMEVCRLSEDPLDDAVGDASAYGLRIWAERDLQLRVQ
jgi:hypothetical protein